MRSAETWIPAFVLDRVLPGASTGPFSMALPMVIAVFGAAIVRPLLRTPSLGHGL